MWIGLYTQTPKIRALFNFFSTALDDKELVNGLNHLISRANAIASCARLIEGLLTFTRGRDAFRSLSVIDDTNGRYISVENYRIVNEKGRPRVIIFPEILKQILCRTRAYLDRIVERIKKLGFEVESSVESTAAIYFFELLKSPTEIRIVPSTRERVALGLYDYPPTHQFGALHHHAMRHLSNFLLRSSGRFLTR